MISYTGIFDIFLFSANVCGEVIYLLKKQKNIKIARITGFILSIDITCVIVWEIRQEGIG